MPRGETNPWAAALYGAGQGLTGFVQGASRRRELKQTDRLRKLQESSASFDQDQAARKAAEAREKKVAADKKAQAITDKARTERQDAMQSLLAEVEEAKSAGVAKWRINKAKSFINKLKHETADPVKVIDNVTNALYDAPEKPAKPEKPTSAAKKPGPAGFTPTEAVKRGGEIFSGYEKKLKGQTGKLREFEAGDVGLGNLEDPEFDPITEILPDELKRQRGLVSDFGKRFPGGAGAQADSVYAGTKDFLSGLPVPDRITKAQETLRKTARGGGGVGFVPTGIGAGTAKKTLEPLQPSRAAAPAAEAAPVEVPEPIQDAIMQMVQKIQSGQVDLEAAIQSARTRPEFKGYAKEVEQALRDAVR